MMVEDTDDAFLEAFERREAERVESLIKIQHGTRDTDKTQRQRVEQLLAQDRADAAAERFREEARTRFECGDSASSADAVIPPTREWETKGPVESYLPRQDPNSTKIVRTVRRQQVPEARKMMADHRINFEGLQACIWYSELFEKTGLSGQIPSVDYAREVFSAPHSRAVFSDQQMDAQDEFRLVQDMINPRFLPLLNAMVLQDIPYYKAERLVKARKGKAKAYFTIAVDELIEARQTVSR